MASVGWIILHRKIEECDIWLTDEPYDKRSAWVDLLLSANHEDKEMIFDGHKITVKRGQHITSVRKLSAKWNWGKNKVLSYLRLLEECEMITRNADSRRTLLTIVNYDIYQNDNIKKGTLRGQSRDSHGTVTGHRQATNKQINNEINNDNNDKQNIGARYYPNDEKLDKAFSDYVAMRLQIRKPMTEKAKEIAIKKLEDLSGGDNDKAIKILEQSIMNSWQGLFPLKDTGQQAKRNLVDEWLNA